MSFFRSGGDVVSYTLTLDIPKDAELYVKRKGSRLQAELNMLVAAVVSAKMRFEAGNEVLDETPGPRLMASFKEGDAIIAGKKKTKWYKSAEALIGDCLA